MDRKFANDLDEASDRVLKMAEQLLIMVEVGQEESKGKGKGKEEVAKTARTGAKASTKTRRRLEDEDDVVDGYKRGVVGVVDGLLEDAVSSVHTRVLQEMELIDGRTRVWTSLVDRRKRRPSRSPQPRLQQQVRR